MIDMQPQNPVENTQMTQPPAPAPVQPAQKWWIPAAVAGSVALVFGVLLFFFILTGLRSAQNTIEILEDEERKTELADGWTALEGDGFRLEFPAMVVTSKQTYPSESGDIKLETNQAASGAGSAYTLTVLEVETPLTELEQSVRNAVAAGVAVGDASLVDERYEPIRNGVMRAYYKVRFIEEGATQEARIIATEQGFYQLIVVYETGAEPQADIDRFLNSFELN